MDANSCWTGRGAVWGLLCSFLVLQLFPAFEIWCKQERGKKCYLLWSVRPSIILLFGKVRALGPTSRGQEALVKITWQGSASVAGCQVEHSCHWWRRCDDWCARMIWIQVFFSLGVAASPLLWRRDRQRQGCFLREVMLAGNCGSWRERTAWLRALAAAHVTSLWCRPVS